MRAPIAQPVSDQQSLRAMRPMNTVTTGTRIGSNGQIPILITPPVGWIQADLREVWAYRELLYFFIWRDIKVRYKQTAIGAAWVIIQPFFAMVVFSLFFGRLAKVPS